jgi:predicted nucleic acid-binding Zn ribbon protein
LSKHGNSNVTSGQCTYPFSPTLIAGTGAGQVTDNCTAFGSLIRTYRVHNPDNSISSWYSQGTSYNFVVGVSQIEYRVVDVAGNVTTCMQQITIQDNQNPTITCPTLAASYNNTTGECGYVVSGTGFNATASDNCGIASLTHNYGGWGNNTTLAGATFPVGTTVVTWTAVDVNGRTSTCSNTIVVNDTQPPTFVNCPSGLTFTIGADANCNTGAIWSIPIATDNCGTVTVTQTAGPALGSQLTPGSYTIQYTATDAALNTTTCSFTINVVDDGAPLLACQPNMIVNANSGSCTYTSSCE